MGRIANASPRGDSRSSLQALANGTEISHAAKGYSRAAVTSSRDRNGAGAFSACYGTSRLEGVGQGSVEDLECLVGSPNVVAAGRYRLRLWSGLWGGGAV